MKSAVLIFSGYNQRAVFAFIRTLKANGVEYSIIARSEEDTIFNSQYVNNISFVRKKSELSLEVFEEIQKQVSKIMAADHFFVAPSTEGLNRFLIDNHQPLKAMGYVVPLVKAEIYEVVSDKLKFSRLCQEEGISIPLEHDSVDNLQPPYVAKPKTYLDSSGLAKSPMLILDEAKHEEFLNTAVREDYYFQEFLEGRSLYLLFYINRKGDVVRFSQENLVQQPGGKSIVAARSAAFHHDDDLCEPYERLFRKINFFGMVMIEVIRTSKGYYMIEANPRFWGPSQLFVDAGVNLFEHYLNDFGIIDLVKKQEEKEVDYFWFGGHSWPSPQMKFHGEYSRESLIFELPNWLRSDIYRRQDTLSVFEKEL